MARPSFGSKIGEFIKAGFVVALDVEISRFITVSRNRFVIFMFITLGFKVSSSIGNFKSCNYVLLTLKKDTKTKWYKNSTRYYMKR